MKMNIDTGIEFLKDCYYYCERRIEGDVFYGRSTLSKERWKIEALGNHTYRASVRMTGKDGWTTYPPVRGILNTFAYLNDRDDVWLVKQRRRKYKNKRA